MSINPIHIIIKATDQASQALRTPIKSFKDFKGALIALAPALKIAMSAAATTFGIMAVKSINAAEEMNRLAQITGFTTEALSGLKYGAEQSETSIDTLRAGLQRMSMNLRDIQRGAGKEAAAAFKDLGITVTNSNGSLKSNEQLLYEVADRLSKISDGGMKTAAAMKIFGKSAGPELIPLLNSGAAGLKAFQKEAEDLGIIISGNTAAAADQFNDNIAKLKNAMSGVVQTIVAEALPQFVGLTNTMVDMAKGFLQNRDNIRMVGDGIIFLTKVAVSGAQVIFNAFKLVGQTLGDLAFAAVQFYSGNFKGALETYKAMFQNIKETSITGVKDIAATWTAGAEQIKSTPIIPPRVGEEIKVEVNKVKDAVETAFSSMAVGMTSAFLVGTGGAKDALMSFFTTALDASIKWAIAQMGILSMVAKAFMFLKANPILAVVAIGGLIAATRALQASMKPETGLAQGGIVTRPTVALVGEAGPEAVLPLNKRGLGETSVVVNLDGRAILSYLGQSIRGGRINLGTGRVQ